MRFFWIITTALFIALGSFLYFLDRQFSENAITISFIHEKNTPKDPNFLNRLKQLLQGQYSYLDRGRQSYVFINEDQSYVLKFFDARCLKQSLLWPFSTDAEKLHCTKKLRGLLKGYHLAYQKDREYSGLLFVQLAPNPNLNLTIDVEDRFGFTHSINLSKVPFAIQKVAIPTRELISQYLNVGHVDYALQAFSKILHMYLEGYSKGLYDTDHNFMYNTGFVDNQPIRIDLGRLKYDERMKDPKFFEKDLRAVLIKRLSGWLQRHYPAYRKEIIEAMDAKIALATVGVS